MQRLKIMHTVKTFREKQQVEVTRKISGTESFTTSTEWK